MEGKTEKDFEWQHIRHLVDTYEDLQKVRIIEMNRARSLLYRKMLVLGYMVEEKKEEEDKSRGKDWNDKKLDEAIKKAKAENKLTSQELEIIDENTKYAKKFKALETEVKNRFTPRIEEHQIWKDYLCNIKGIGVLTGARLICHLGDCSKFETISKLWAYSGYKVIDGVAQRRTRGEKAMWNRRVKVLGYLIADVFVKHRTKYRTMIYDPERIRLKQLHPEKEVSKDKWDGVHKTRWNDKHLDNIARRKMIKVFLANYWLFVRKMNGLPTESPYIIGKPRENGTGVHSTLMSPTEFFEVKI